jgi:hypothetical protein
MDTEPYTLAIDERVLDAPLWTILRVAEIAAETYDRVENPGRYGDDGSSAAVLEWFPKLEVALRNAGLLYHL